MRSNQSKLALSLALTLSLNALIASADSVLIPRMGFTTYQDKTLTIVHEEPKVIEPKKEEVKEKATAESTPIANTEANLSVSAGQESAAASELNAVQHVEKKPEESKKIGLFSKLFGSDKNKPKLQKHVAVYGDFFLYGMKQRSILYKAQGQSATASKTLWGLGGKSDKVKISDEKVVFSQPVQEGLYTLSVMGSGHFTQKPFWVSDSVYWDAIKPLIRDMGQYHCPLTKGKFVSLQNCYNLPILPEDPALANSENIDLDKVRVVKAGWFSENVDLHDGVVKNTANIAKLTNLLANLYAINPESFEFLEVDGLVFKESPLPDILDELGWGLQYLQTAQLQNGGYPEGLRGIAYSRYYELMPESAEATSYAIGALTQAATLYQERDLQYSLSLMQSAVKAWQALSANSQATPGQKDFAAISLKAALAQPAFQNTFVNVSIPAASTTANLDSEQVLQLGGRQLEVGLTEPVDMTALMGDTATDISSVEMGVSAAPMVDDLVVLETRPSLTAYKSLAKQVEMLYGYEKVPFKFDPRYELAASYKDPLAFLAFKAGQGIEKFNENLDEKNIIHKAADLPADYLEQLETKEKDAKALQIKGFKGLGLGQMDRVRLAYGLGLLSNNVDILTSGKVKAKKKRKEQPTDTQPLFQTEEKHPMENGKTDLPTSVQ